MYEIGKQLLIIKNTVTHFTKTKLQDCQQTEFLLWFLVAENYWLHKLAFVVGPTQFATGPWMRQIKKW